ncbi:uncharacterized mitochondrial protein AtMg00810-like [Rutidosis leptorrhynchoides]|uniref:uncharacterized mitochondrial protein AtMg00810-like n=1 Tax=Rutidosis leptorrhynchoides TaxID=125765 RepID=UPI003A9968F7
MKDLGHLSSFLGISVQRTSNGLFLNQTNYAKYIIERAGMVGCKAARTPVDTNGKLNSNQGKLYSVPTKFQSLAGALQYLTFMQPDISYVVQKICLHIHNPKECHMNSLKRIVRYIQGIVQYGLHLYKSLLKDLVSYTDADWGGFPDTRRSTSRYCVFFGNILISWSYKRKPTVSRSSAKAEYCGAANVVFKSCWLRNLLLELQCPITKAMPESKRDLQRKSEKAKTTTNAALWPDFWSIMPGSRLNAVLWLHFSSGTMASSPECVA